MTRIEKKGLVVMIVLLVTAFLLGVVVGWYDGRRAAIRELHDVATCPTCGGTGVVVQEESR